MQRSLTWNLWLFVFISWMAIPSTVQADATDKDSLARTLAAALIKDDPSIDPQLGFIKLREDRDDIEFYEYKDVFRFHFYRSSDPSASLVFLIPGLGASYKDNLANYLAEKIFLAGHHVVVVPNQFHWTFALQVSRSGMPGLTRSDAVDMHEALLRIRRYVSGFGIQPRKVQLVGYSLGGTLAGHVARVDDIKRQPIGFDRVILINPAVRLLRCLKKVSEFVDNGRRIGFFNRIGTYVKYLLHIQKYRTHELNQSVFDAFIRELQPTETELKVAVGKALMMPLPKVAHVSQQIEDLKIFKVWDIESNQRQAEASTLTYEDYWQRFLRLRLYHQTGRWYTSEEISWQNGLLAMKTYLRHAEHIYLIHNKDDNIVLHENIDELEDAFNGRTVVFNSGGHMGNLWRDEFQEALFHLLQE